jgi:YggT family protein
VISLARIINFIVQVITLIVVVKVFSSYFLSPYHSMRIIIDRIVEPLLKPIRKLIPPIGIVDISPIILIIIIQIFGKILINLVLAAR